MTRYLSSAEQNILAFLALFTDNIGPLSDIPLREVPMGSAEWWNGIEQLRRDWIAQAPEDWPELMIGLLEQPPSFADLASVSVWMNDQDDANRAFVANEILGLWGREAPEQFFALISPRLRESPARKCLVAAVGETFLPQGLECLTPLFDDLEGWNEDEIIALIDAVGDIIKNNQGTLSDQALQELRSHIPGHMPAALREVELYLSA